MPHTREHGYSPAYSTVTYNVLETVYPVSTPSLVTTTVGKQPNALHNLAAADVFDRDFVVVMASPRTVETPRDPVRRG